MRPIQQGLRWLAHHIYGGFLPCPDSPSKGARDYLVDLWRQAPWFVALAHTLLATIVLFLPPFILKRWRLFSQLSQEEKNRFQHLMIHSRIYFMRTIAYGVKGHALVATFRDPSGRKQFESGFQEKGKAWESPSGTTKPITLS